MLVRDKTSYIIFDGHCGFCHKGMLFIAKRDKKDTFLLVSNQSKLGQKLLVEQQIKGLEAQTVILINSKAQIHIKSKAVIEIFKSLPYLKLLAYLIWVVPKPLRDYFYILVSKNRYLLVSKQGCEIPTKELAKKFVLH